MNYLKPSERHILSVLDQHADSNGATRISMIELASVSGYDPKTVACGLKRLEAMAYILRYQPDPRRASIYQRLPASQQLAIAMDMLNKANL